MTIRPQFWLPLFGALMIGTMPGALAQKYPDRPVTMIVPFPAGGLTDVPARVAATMMSQKIGQNMVVENKTGATGTIGAAFAARSAPDGYTLFANSTADAQNVHFQKLTYSPVDDFIQIGWIVDGPPLVAIVNAQLPYKTLKDMIAAAKADPKAVSFGTSGPASSPGMALAMFNAAAKTPIVPVPYRGSGDAARAVAGGQVQGVFAYYSQAKPLVDGGQVRPLAVAGPTRIAAWPDVPTFAELGFKIDFRGYVGLAAPAKTPRPIVDLLNKALIEVTQSEAFKSRMEALGMSAVPAADNTPEKYDAFLRADIVLQGQYAKVAQDAEPAEAKK